MRGNQSPAWSEAGWQATATDWLDAALAGVGRRRIGAVEREHVRPWSIVLSAATDGGPVYLKSTAEETANDAGLTSFLSVRAPDLVLRPLAVDPPRRLLLLPHGGTLMREVAKGPAEVEQWNRILPRYAELQMRLAAETDDLLAAGALDRRLGGLVAQYLELLEDPAHHAGLNPHGVDDDELARLRQLGPRLRAACAELTELAIPESIQHDDLHSANVLLKDGEVRILDWGDASVTHPFGTLLVTLRSAAYHAGLDEGDEALRRLRDAYLEPWTSLVARRDLLRAAELASWLGLAVRALIWRAALRTADEGELSEWQDGVPEALRMLMVRAPRARPGH